MAGVERYHDSPPIFKKEYIMKFTRDYWIELACPTGAGQTRITVEDISHVNIVDYFIYFSRGLNVVLAVPVSNVLFYGSKDHDPESKE